MLVIGLLVPACPTWAKDHYSQAGPINLDRRGEKCVQHTLGKMSTEEMVGQLLVVWARAEFFNVNSPQYHQFTEEIQRYHVGAFALSVPVEGRGLGIPFIQNPHWAACSSMRAF